MTASGQQFKAVFAKALTVNLNFELMLARVELACAHQFKQVFFLELYALTCLNLKAFELKDLGF